jgi:glycosyltransferase involved in cell wall biosynthesis
VTTPKFSVCTIVRNESRNIVHLLDSLRDFIAGGGDVVVMDTGSTDETPQIALDAGARVTQIANSFFRYTITAELAKAINEEFVEPGEDPLIPGEMTLFDFSKARNTIITLAKNDMIFSIDADEVVLKLDVDLCNEKIDEGWDRLEQDYTDIRLGAHYFLNYRWYNRKVYHFEGAMHELICGNGKMGRLPPAACSVEHRPTPSPNRASYLPGMALGLYLEPDRSRQTHWFARQLMYEGRPKSAIRFFVQHILMPNCTRGDI